MPILEQLIFLYIGNINILFQSCTQILFGCIRVVECRSYVESVNYMLMFTCYVVSDSDRRIQKLNLFYYSLIILIPVLHYDIYDLLPIVELSV